MNVHERGTKTLLLTSSASLLLGLIVLLGWYLQDPRLIQILPQLAPMQYNTALSFFCCGLAGFACVYNYQRSTRTLGFLVALMGLLVLIQYIFNVSLGIDELFIKDHIIAHTSHPGRMAPNTALCFFFLGGAFLIGGFPKCTSRSLLWSILGTLVTSLGAIALSGYTLGFKDMYGWGSLTSMALHTSLGFILLGTGVLVSSWAKNMLPVTTGFFIATLSLCLWQALLTQQELQIRQSTSRVAHSIKRVLQTVVQERKQALRRMAKRLETRPSISKSEWQKDAHNYIAHHKSYQMLIRYNHSPKLWWSAKPIDQQISLPNQKQIQTILYDQLKKKVTSTHITPILSAQKEKKDKKLFFIPVPVYSKKTLSGYIVGIFHTKDFFQSILNPFTQDYALSLNYQKNIIFSSNSIRLNPQQAFSIKTPLWHYTIAPKAGADVILRPWIPQLVLFSGFAFTLLVSLMLYFAQKASLRNEELEVRVKKRTEELELSKESLQKYTRQLEQTNKELDDFAYIASHDLKEPLRGINHYTSFLIKRYREQLDTKGQSKLDTIKLLTYRMEEQINALLHYSYIGRSTWPQKDVDLHKVLQETIGRMRVRIEENQLEIHVPRALPSVDCDEARLRELFSHLLTNAMRYNDNPSKQIEIGFIEGGKGSPVIFYVKDNGVGIKEKHQESMFRIFKKLHHQNKFGESIGAGLTIAKKIIECHSGKLWVESTYGEGSTFYFTLQKERG